jgi:hypothetical protein
MSINTPLTIRILGKAGTLRRSIPFLRTIEAVLSCSGLAASINQAQTSRA